MTGGSGWGVDKELATVMLELARRLSAEPPPLTVGFVSFGAKEWGLVGSRSLSETWPGHWPVRALVNIDSVGRRGAQLQVIGAARAPKLARTIASAAAARGIERGASAERGLEAEGSDHRPWAEKGVAAVTVSQAGPAMAGEPENDIESIDFDALALLVDALEKAIRQLASGAES